MISPITVLQLQNILKFGVDKLLENDDSSIETMDFDAILGPTVDTEWTEVADKQSLVSKTMIIKTANTIYVQK